MLIDMNLVKRLTHLGVVDKIWEYLIFSPIYHKKPNTNINNVEENNEKGRDEIYSERVKAGKRTYFFDVKATRSNDYYLTITESKRKPKDYGFFYEKHKIFLYKEDFNKFVNALNTTVNHVKDELMPEVDFDQFDRHDEEHEVVSAGVSESDSDLKWD